GGFAAALCQGLQPAREVAERFAAEREVAALPQLGRRLLVQEMQRRSDGRHFVARESQHRHELRSFRGRVQASSGTSPPTRTHLTKGSFAASTFLPASSASFGGSSKRTSIPSPIAVIPSAKGAKLMPM